MTEKEKLDAIVEAIPEEQRDNVMLNAHIKRPNASRVVFDIISKDDLERLQDVYRLSDEALVVKTEEEQKQEVLEVKKQMVKIQAKKYITTKECAEIYNRSTRYLQNAKGRIHDPLPYHQTVAGGKIVYVVEEIEDWFNRNEKGRHSKAK